MAKQGTDRMTDTTTPGATAAPPQPLSPAGDPVGIAWSGPTWGLAGLGLVNFLLSIITLGIYHFWAKTEVRRRLVSSIRINGEPMEYTGTGMELFLGFIISLLVVLLPFQLLIFGAQIYFGPQNPASGLIVFAALPFIFYLYGVAAYRARRYRRSRLRWRGVRGAVVGNSWTYGLQALWTSVVGLLASGWLTPWRDNYLHRRITGDTRFGDRPFKYSGQAGPLYPVYALAWVGQVVIFLVVAGLGAALLWPVAKPVFEAIQAASGPDNKIDWQSPELRAILPQLIGLVSAAAGVFVVYAMIASVLWSLFYAREYRYFADNTALEGLHFKLSVSGWSLFWLFLSNTLLSLLTLTILSPVAEARVARYFIRRLSSNGSIDFAGILQSQERLSKTGEGLAEAFDVEANSYFILSI